MRRNKKNYTAAQVHGKTTGRWTDEEHDRFSEGKLRLLCIIHMGIYGIYVFQIFIFVCFHAIIAIRLYGKNWKKVT